MKTKAFSYVRFSSGIQSKGRSRARQQDSPEVQQFIHDHKLEVVEKMVDSGISGFSGKNFSETKALGRFIELVKAGAIEKGSVLLMENLDRFSRSEITDCIDKFIQIIRNGVSIGVVQMNLIIDRTQANNQMVWQYVNNEFFRARRESERKSGFAIDNLRAKIKRAKAGELIYFGAQSPLWIRGIKDGKWMLDDEKVKTFKRGFALYLEGHSCHHIAKLFNTDNVPIMRGKTLCRWTQSTIKYLLQSRNVIGYCKVMDFENNNYYPVIVKPADWTKVQAKLRMNTHNRGNSPTGDVPNLFKGILRCTCGSSIIVNRNSYVRKNGMQTYYGYCRCKYVNGCPNSFTFNMHFLEIAILSAFPRCTALLNKPVATPETDKLKDKLAIVEATIGRFTDVLADPELKDLTELKTKFKEQVAMKNELAKQINDSQLKTVQLNQLPKASASLFKLLTGDKEVDIENAQSWMDDLTAFLKSKENRFKVRNLMSEIFQKITLQYETKPEHKNIVATCSLLSGSSYQIKLIINGPRDFIVELL
jgi:DNA invertase Pin-like site-specific DNA recombinase